MKFCSIGLVVELLVFYELVYYRGNGGLCNV